jgi:nanoRNase/pAp phosphatase (c-di-AMP/oligoRNAs hydrolase)
MNKNQSVPAASQLISEKNSFAILLNSAPSLDAVCAGLSLFMSLNKAGKSVSIACSSKINYPGVFEIDKVGDKLISSGNTLVVSFPYSEGAVDKVSYQIEDGNFNLIIQPQVGAQKLNSSDVKFNYSGEDFDVLITINSPSLNAIGNVYAENKEKFKDKEIINIDRNINNEQYGSINIVDKSSVCETVFFILKSLNFQIDQKIASNLYNGLLYSTNNLTLNNVTPETYEACAFLTREGAVKFTRPNNGTSPVVHNSFEKGGTQKIVEVENKEIKKDDSQKDWLKPNIFKGGNLI